MEKIPSPSSKFSTRIDSIGWPFVHYFLLLLEDPVPVDGWIENECMNVEIDK